MALAPTALRECVRTATLAPSSHNSQPWWFRCRSDAIELLADRTRALPVVDPHDRELTISCGAALQNLRLALRAAGVQPRVRLLPDLAAEELLAEVGFDPAGGDDPTAAALHAAIPRRRTWRRPFAARPVAAAASAALAAAAAAEGGHWQVVDGEAARAAVAALVAEGDARQWADPRWRRELAQWLHPRRRGDGLAVPGLVAPLAQAVVRTFDLGHGVAAKDRDLAAGSPLLAVLGTAGDTPRDWLLAGQALQAVLLTAVQHGLQASYLNQPVEVPELRPRLAELCPGARVPQLLLRLGHAEGDLPPAPRRPVEQVLAAPA